jgi:uncharacterized protein (TIGR02391 family)
MTTLAELIPDAENMLDLEPEELAIVAFGLMPESPQRLHPSGFCHPDTYGSYPVERRGQIECAMMEAWGWLAREGLIALRPGDNQWHFITRRGLSLKTPEDFDAFRKSAFLPRTLLHPVIEKACWQAYMRGDYDTAVFQAYKELEVHIRLSSGASAEDHGVPLVRKAFNPTAGPLTDPNPDAVFAEKEALANLAAGAIGSYKNPHSHRRVTVAVQEAAEMIVLANHLYKIVDSRRHRSG